MWLRPLAPLFFPLPAFAAPEADGFTLDACRASARNAHPIVAAARAQAAAAKAREAVSFSGFLPTIAGEASYALSDGALGGARPGASESDVATTFTAQLTARQTLWDFGRTLNAHQGAGATLDAARSELRLARAQRDVEAEAAFRTTLAAEELVTAAREAVERAAAQLKRAQARVEVGQRPKFDAIRAEVEVAQADLGLVAATNARALAAAQLASACGLATLPAETILTPPPARDSAVPAPDAALAEAERNRPELTAARDRLRAAEQAYEAARSQYLPALSANGAWGLRGASPSEVEPGWTALAMLNVPIIAGGADAARVREAEALLGVASARLEDLTRSTHVEVNAGRLAMVETQARLEASVRLERSAAEGLRLAEARYETGAGDAVELADAQSIVAQARAARVRAALDVELAAARLDYTLGRIPPGETE